MRMHADENLGKEGGSSHGKAEIGEPGLFVLGIVSMIWFGIYVGGGAQLEMN